MKAYLGYPHNSTDINVYNEETDELICVVKNNNVDLAKKIVELVSSLFEEK